MPRIRPPIFARRPAGSSRCILSVGHRHPRRCRSGAGLGRQPVLRRDARQGHRAGADREEALVRLAGALDRTRIAGPKTNLAFLSAIVASPEFRAGGVDTGFIDRELDELVGAPLDHGLAAARDRRMDCARG